jgi:hypothetical protein
MTSTVRVLPPIDVRYQKMIVFGRSYAGAPGATLDVLDSDAAVLTANNWIRVGRSSTTATRPTDARVGETLLDTTLGIVIIWDGANWRNPVTGVGV